MAQTMAQTPSSNEKNTFARQKFSDSLLSLITLLFLIALFFLSFYANMPPAAVSTDAPASEFSSGRAMQHIRAIAQSPHPVGTPEHAKVRDYILNELTTLGLDPHVQKSPVIAARAGSQIIGADVENIFGKIPGFDNDRAVLLVAHYDSVPGSPGASDDGSGVATVIETLRAIKALPTLKNDLMFLFTDAEEMGLLGAKGFVEEDPAAKEIEVVLNFEARGNGGPTFMFETSDENGWLIREFARATPFPVANSLSYEVYKRLPNDTDFTVFKKAGMVGLNFAYIKGLTHYHTEIDNVESLDERSLQHSGSYALALAHHFGNLNIERTREPNDIYFNIPGSIIIHYPETWSKLISISVAIIFIGVAAAGIRKKQLKVTGIMLGFLTLLSAMITAALISSLIWSLIGMLSSQDELAPWGEFYSSLLYFAGFAALTLAIVALEYNWFKKKISLHDLYIGGLLWWLLLMIAASLLIPGASYLFAWPLLFALIPMIYIFLSADRRTDSFPYLVLTFVCAIPAVVLVAPTVYMLYLAMGLRMLAVLAVMIVLLIGILIPHLGLITKTKSWLLPVTSLLLAIAIFIVAAYSSDSDKNNRLVNTLFYAVNADSGKAVWASSDSSVDEWTKRFFGEGLERGQLTEYFDSGTASFMKAEAPLASLAAPTVSLLSDNTVDDTRLLRFRVASGQQAPVIRLTVDSESEILKAEVGSKMVDASGKNLRLRYYGAPAAGIEIAFRLKPAGAVKIRVSDIYYGLSVVQNILPAPRPDNIMASPSSLSDVAVISKSFAF